MIQQNQSISSQIGAESLEVKKLNVHINSEIGSADVNIEADEPKEPERQNKRRLEQEGDNQRKDGEVPERQNKRRKEERDSPQKEGEGDRCQVEEKRQGTEQRIESHEYVLRVGQQMVGHQGFISFMKNAPNCKLHYCVENDQRIFTLQQTQQRGHSKLLNGPCMSCNKDHVIVGNLVNRDTILIDRGHTVAYLCAKARPFISVCPFSEQKCFNDHKSLSEEEFNYLFSLVDHICQGIFLLYDIYNVNSHFHLFFLRFS